MINGEIHRFRKNYEKLTFLKDPQQNLQIGLVV